ncbi:T9SS type A sorting domain-containing protein [candidate division KSB1 bacterium]|nr:T9SS type A sorting domain-containing protein [candidate division KSB1 bacterium]
MQFLIKIKFVLLFLLLGTTCPLNAKVLAYYPFNGNANDESGNGNNGFVYGPVLTEDRYGNSNSAYYFDGTDDFILLGDTDFLKPRFPMTLIAWINLDCDAYYPPVFVNNYCEDHYNGIIFNIVYDNYLAINFGNGDFVGPQSRRSKTGTTLLLPNRWYHIAVIIRGVYNMELYVNGQNDGGTYSGNGSSLVYTEGPAKLGVADGSRYEGGERFFKGKMDDIYFCDHAFTSQQIMSHYQETVTEQTSKNETLPKTTILYQNYPNPFNPTTTIQYQLLKSTTVSLTIYDLLGNEINQLLNQYQETGMYRILWESKNSQDQYVPNGIYIYKLQTDRHVYLRKMIVLQ